MLNEDAQMEKNSAPDGGTGQKKRKVLLLAGWLNCLQCSYSRVLVNKTFSYS